MKLINYEIYNNHRNFNIVAKICGENEEHNPCGPSCPEASCENTKPDPCLNKMCKDDCFCKKGYVRNDENKCIPIKKCRKYI